MAARKWRQMTTQKQTTAPLDINGAINQFVEAFNRNDLDGVMGFFAEDAVYRPGDGSEHRGRAAIRCAFEPQFAAAYGKMSFDEHDRMIDAASGKAAIRWVCRHDLSTAKPARLALNLQRIVAGLVLGRRFGWEGLDLFHFNAEAKITGKFTYANYWTPRFRRELG